MPEFYFSLENSINQSFFLYLFMKTNKIYHFKHMIKYNIKVKQITINLSFFTVDTKRDRLFMSTGGEYAINLNAIYYVHKYL